MKESSFVAEQYLEVATIAPRSSIQLLSKRILDVGIAGIALCLSLPLLLLVAVAIKVSSRGPLLYRQVRVGQGRRPFMLLKFRTMLDGADKRLHEVIHLNTAYGPLFKAKNDPRITFVGKWLRRSFIDEIPQLVNVLRGEMSLVGPRPCLPPEAAQMQGEAALRFLVPQGLTGPWQVNGHNDLTFDRQVVIESEYVRNWSLSKDLHILVRTIPMVVTARGC